MAKNAVTQTEMDRAARLVSQYGSIRAAAKGAGIVYSTLYKHYRLAQEQTIKLHNPTVAAHDGEATPLPNKDRLRLEDRIRTLEKLLRDGNKAELNADKISEFYFDLKKQAVVEPDWLLKTATAHSGVPGVPVATWSDWHYGEVVKPDQVEGANEFNIAVFDRRYNTLVERTIDLCHNHMTVGAAGYPGIVVNLGGDLISGDIHEKQNGTNEVESIQAVLDLVGKIVWGLKSLADKFGHVAVRGVPGNHGRNTMKPQAKNACYTSFDWMICKLVASHLAGDDRFTFDIPNGFDCYYKVYGHRILLTHGDRTGARGGDGFIGAIGPIMRGAHKLRLSYAARGREVDTLIMGHWHNEITLPGLRVNNCIKGYDEWAMSMRFTPTPPSQDLFFIHQTRGVTCSWPIQLEKPSFGDDNASWTSVR